MPQLHKDRLHVLDMLKAKVFSVFRPIHIAAIYLVLMIAVDSHASSASGTFKFRTSEDLWGLVKPVKPLHPEFVFCCCPASPSYSVALFSSEPHKPKQQRQNLILAARPLNPESCVSAEPRTPL